MKRPLIAVALAGGLAALATRFDLNAAPKELWVDADRSSVDASVRKEADELNTLFTKVTEKAAAAVVKIYTKTKVPLQRRGNPFNMDDEVFRHFFGSPFGQAPYAQPEFQEAQSLGSGFVINQDGYIVTNAHVIRAGGKNADEVQVTFIGEAEDSKGYAAEIIGADESTDVAVIKLKTKPKKGLTVLPIGDSDKLKLGEWVLAIGNPFGYSFSVSQGIVSGMGRNLNQDHGNFIQRVNFIQTDASINVGNSGGPLINIYGETIGINTQVDARAQGIGFAIPINVAKRVVRQLIEKGQVEYGWMGIAATPLTPDIAAELGLKNAKGVLLRDVFDGEPADKGGLKAYDIITKVDGKDIENYRDFLLTIGNYSIGQEVKLDYMREGKARSATVKIGRRPNESKLAQAQPRTRRGGGRSQAVQGETGIVLTPLTPGIRAQLQIEPEVKGVVIDVVAPSSAAERSGLQPGDVILEVQRKPVPDIASAQKAFADKRQTYLLKVRRGPATMIVLLDLRAAE